jgi:hypothetical protein
MTAQARKLTPSKIVKACRKGARLWLQHGAKATFTLQPPGCFVPARYALGAIASGKIKPAYDGLFAGHSQSWGASPTPAAAPPVPAIPKNPS